MKKVALAAAVSLAATSAFAGNMSEPMMEMDIEVVEEATSSSNGGILVPLMLLVLIAAAAS